MSEEILHVFRQTLKSFKFPVSESFAETFAIDRFNKKFEEPSSDRVNQLHVDAWDAWILTDDLLPGEIHLPKGNWYKARESIHSLLPVQLDRKIISFPRGSEFFPTRGHNSLESRLCASKWSCTDGNFELFARLCYRHKGLKRAVRNRYADWHSKTFPDLRKIDTDRFLFSKFKANRRSGFNIFKWKLQQCTTIVHGSRFSTVPKNNEKRRPINVEPFGNLLSQRLIGNHIRDELKRIFDVDLDTLATKHRQRISDPSVATIDLSNASDSVSLALCKFLLPSHIYKLVSDSRSPMIYSNVTKCWHLPKKVSSMGNGFTFELMTLILTAIGRTLDPECTVFGDDIIIRNDCAAEMIQLIESVGFKVNVDKTFISSSFRESCGANFQDGYGYIESYDFHWPNHIGDCVMVLNKCRRLSFKYRSFKNLYHNLCRFIPKALHGGRDYEFDRMDPILLIGHEAKEVNFPPYFLTGKLGGSIIFNEDILCKLADLGYDPSQFRLIKGFSYVPELRSSYKTDLKSRDWAKYEMYLESGRRVKDVITDKGRWVSVSYISNGSWTFRTKNLLV